MHTGTFRRPYGTGCLVSWIALALLILPAHARAQPFAYVTNSGSASVSVINVATNGVVATVPVGGRPIGVVFSPNGSRVYVANSTSHAR